MRSQFLVLAALLAMCPSTVLADIDGKPILEGSKCSGAYASADMICSLLNKGGGIADGKCSVTANLCGVGEQEFFVGNTTELASGNNIKNWTGFGGAYALKYQQAHLCLLRDIKDQPITSFSEAATDLGSVGFKQMIHMQKFDREKLEWTGYHSGRACAPAIGCLDIFNQKITVRAVYNNIVSEGKKAGDYKILWAHGMSTTADSIAQGFAASIKAISVKTPYGEISASPEFNIGRAIGYVLAPYDGNNVKSVYDFGQFGKAKMMEVYGRNPGTNITQMFPEFMVFGSSTKNTNPLGYISQVAYGSRVANPKGNFWKAPLNVEWPARPDSDLSIPRNKAEGVPNGYMGASVKVQYSPTELLPAAVRGNKHIKVDFTVWAKPLIQSGFTSQVSMSHYEVAKGNKLVSPNGPLNYLAPNMDQFKAFGLMAGSSAAVRTALEAGVDLRLHLHIPIPIPGVDDIDITLVDIHPRAVVAEKELTNVTKSPYGISAVSQASQTVASGKWFQYYISPKTNYGSDGADKQIDQCLAEPTVELPMPPYPSYEPGNPSDLTKNIKYPCNICYGYETVTYNDQAGVTQVIPKHLEQLFPASQHNKPSDVRWACDTTKKSGCYDMCTYDPTANSLTVFETAVEMIAAGKAQGMPGRCGGSFVKE